MARPPSRWLAGLATLLAVAGLVVTAAPAQARALRPTSGRPFAPASWSQQAELAASDGVTGEDFGNSVAVSGSVAVIGAPSAFQNCCPGAAYVFLRSNGVWTQQQKLTPSDGATNDGFGSSVAISGSTVVLGAPDKNTQAGAAYVFVRSNGIWSQQAELTASDGVAYDHFGSSVAASGSTVIVGAADKDSQAGAAYVFVRSNGIWSQQAKLSPSDGLAHDFFGASVAASGPTAVVGAYGSPGGGFTGAAYVFVRSNGIWSQQAKLTAYSVGIAYFGTSVAISGSTAVVGAPLEPHGQGRGATYVFVRSGNVWSKPARLTASDGAPGDEFGHSVAVSGSTALVGAPNESSATGAAYAFENSGGIWSEQAKLIASDGAMGDQFGNSVAVSGSTALVGAWIKDSAAGAAYVFVSV